MVECVKLSSNTVLVLELLVEKQLWVKLEFEVIATQVLYVVFYHNLNSFSYLYKTNNVEHQFFLITDFQAREMQFSSFAIPSVPLFPFYDQNKRQFYDDRAQGLR